MVDTLRINMYLLCKILVCWFLEPSVLLPRTVFWVLNLILFLLPQSHLLCSGPQTFNGFSLELTWAWSNYETGFWSSPVLIFQARWADVSKGKAGACWIIQWPWQYLCPVCPHFHSSWVFGHQLTSCESSRHFWWLLESNPWLAGTLSCMEVWGSTNILQLKSINYLNVNLRVSQKLIFW